MKTTTITCKNCGIKCEKSLREINRQKRNGRTEFYCSISCAISNTHIKCVKITSICLWCKNKFETTTQKKARKCCSLDCARKYSQSFVDTNNISKGVKKYLKNNPTANYRPTRMEDRKCVMCQTKFNVPIWKKVKTCGKECHHKLLSMNSTNNPNCGGETNYKRYMYNGMWMDSSWEVEIAKLLDMKNVEWERSRKKHMFWWTDVTGKKRRYYPDFYLPKYNVYLDPKNKYGIKLGKFKMESVIKENNIVLIWGLLLDVKTKIEELLVGRLV